MALTGAHAKELRSIRDEISAAEKIARTAREKMTARMRELCGWQTGDVVRHRGTEYRISKIKVDFWDHASPSIYVTLYGCKKTKSGWHASECYIGSPPGVEKVSDAA